MAFEEDENYITYRMSKKEYKRIFRKTLIGLTIMILFIMGFTIWVLITM